MRLGMPSILAAVYMIAALTACATEKTGMETEVLRAFATDYSAAWSSQDPQRVAAFFAVEGALRINEGDASVGRDAIAAAAQGFMTALPDMVVAMDSIRVEPNLIEFHWTLVATNTGPGGTGNAVRVSGFEEWTIDSDGLIAASQGHFPDAEYARQLEHGVDS